MCVINVVCVHVVLISRLYNASLFLLTFFSDQAAVFLNFRLQTQRGQARNTSHAYPFNPTIHSSLLHFSQICEIHFRLK